MGQPTRPDVEHRSGGSLRQDVPAGRLSPNHRTTSEHVSSEENAMVGRDDPSQPLRTSTPTGAPTSATSSAAPSSRVGRLAAQATEAAQVRALTAHPDVIALRVERVRAQVDRLLWAGIVLGLAFTMVNVQTFAAHGAERFSAVWWVAWLLDPMVSLVLLAVLRAEQVTARYQVELTAWGRRTKWLTFAATYVMNTWSSWGFADTSFSAAGVVLHSVPPLVVFFAAETGPGLRDRLTEAVHRALVEHTAREAATAHDTTETTTDDTTTAVAVAVAGGLAALAHEPIHGPVHEPATTAVRAVRRRPVRRGKPVPRRLLADYVTAAREALDAACAAGEQIDPPPAWCRRASGCSTGTSVKVAAALRELPAVDPAPTVAAVPAPAPSTPSSPVERKAA